jgi:hypothetical protein
MATLQAEIVASSARTEQFQLRSDALGNFPAPDPLFSVVVIVHRATQGVAVALPPTDGMALR